MKRQIFLTTLSVLSLTAFAQAPDRSKAPDPGPIDPLKLPAAESFTLSNGIKVHFVKKDQVPLVQINLIANGGSIFETDSELGLASLTADLMTEGAGKRTALELADEIDYLGIRLDSWSGQEQMGVNLFAPVSRLTAALDLMRDVVLYPAFSEDELNRARTSKLVALGQQHDEARVIASQAFNQQIFGKNHPLGRPSAGTEATLKSFTTGNLKAFHGKIFTTGNVTLIVAGALDPKDLKTRLEAAFGKLKPGRALATPKLEVPVFKPRKIILVDKPGAAQTELRIGHPGVNRMTPDYYTLTVVNTILGGSFTSRLNQNIREEHGYAYGANSRFGLMKNTGAFLAGSAVQTEVTDSAVFQFMKELTGIQVIREEDMTRARNYVALSFPSDFVDVQSVADQIGNQVFYNLPGEYFNTYTGKILGVTRDQAIQAAKTYIRPENLTLVVVGDRAKIEAGLRGLNLGEIQILTVDDVLGPVPNL